ncbi:MAG: linked oxidase domain protein [Gemmatimonadetes bacterium]|nr:linked oxidase domain protein [Gemmatimonadota bacterium]
MSDAAGAVSRDEDVRRSAARDASGLELIPEAVARPTEEGEVVEIIAQALHGGGSVTPAGGQTSTTAASITDRGTLLSLRELGKVIEVDDAARTARVQAGVLLGELKRMLAERGLLFAPDPTSEDDVTVGGAIACNASGARSLRYGATRPHVIGLRVALADGTVADVRRSGLEKNTAGFAAAQEPVDWFVGSEGTLGVILEAELALLPLPQSVTGLGIPFASEDEALRFVAAARQSREVSARCLEFLDEGAFAIARASRGEPWAEQAHAFVYVEEVPEGDNEPALDAWLALAEAHGARDADVVVFQGEAELREARKMRHAVPAAMHERAAPFRQHGGRRVSTDWAVPYRRLPEAIAHSRSLAASAGIEQAVTFGHAGNGHPHQNYVARSAGELARIESVVEQTLRHVISLGGTVAAEHGIGKIKRKWLPLQMSATQLRVMQGLKDALDPKGVFAPGNVL